MNIPETQNTGAADSEAKLEPLVQQSSEQESIELKRYYERRCAKCGQTFDGRKCQSCYCPTCQRLWLESQK